MDERSGRVKMLIAVDGQAPGGAAARHVLRLLDAGLQAELHLLNVQPALESGHLRMFVSAEEVQGWYRAEGLEALAACSRLLTEAGVGFQPHVAVGHAAETILRFVVEHRFELLVIGADKSTLPGLLLGSVASPLLKSARVPVLVAR